MLLVQNQNNIRLTHFHKKQTRFRCDKHIKFANDSKFE